MNPSDKIKSLQRRAAEKNESFLPHWQEDNRAAPNEIVRSALFNARNKNQKRTYFKQAEIALIGNGSIKSNILAKNCVRMMRLFGFKFCI